MSINDLLQHGPTIIGATGGSGTRVLARMVRRGGLFIGKNLNVSEDALSFGGYSDRWANSYLRYRTSAVPRTLELRMATELMELLARHCEPLLEDPRPWGWKEPRSILFLPFFHAQMPSLKFVHVIRDGRDMAFSENQNQLRKHGAALLNWKEQLRHKPVRSIMLWSRINSFAADYGEQVLGENYLRIRFEDLCQGQIPVIERVFHFLKLDGDISALARDEVKPPKTLGRWREKNPRMVEKLNRAAGASLSRFGYS